MPRKYRPPTAKRRKDRKTTIPYDFEGPSDSSVTVEDGALDEEAPMIAVDVADPEPEPEDRPLRASRKSGSAHVARNYDYVRGELVRIAVIAAFLVIALVITSILR